MVEFVREQYQLDKSGLPGTKEAFEKSIEHFCVIKRALQFEMTFAFLAATGILVVKPLDDENANLVIPDTVGDQYTPLINTVASRQVISFSEGWKSICDSKKTFSTLAEFPLAQQLILEQILVNLVGNFLVFLVVVC